MGTLKIGEIWVSASGCTWRIDQLMKRKIWEFFNFPPRIEIEIDLNFFGFCPEFD
jgi:hypothetical protein